MKIIDTGSKGRAKIQRPISQSRNYLYWKVALITFGIIALATCLVPTPGFWSSYVLDIVGPAWIYILVRGLFSKTQPAMLARFLSPEVALVICIVACFLIESAQYFRLYEAHYDSLDFVAYVSLLVPCYATDRWLVNHPTRGADVAN
jgi:hypothetical protein